MSASNALLDERALSKLRWRCRRGLLENDLFIERFFDRHAASLTVRQAEALGELMDLADNDLLDLCCGAGTRKANWTSRTREKCWRCCAGPHRWAPATEYLL